MSCQPCDDAQDKPVAFFYRWKNANIEVRACDQHVKEVFEALNNAQRYAEAQARHAKRSPQ